MADKIRVGVVGANATRGSWGSRAHVPALKALPDYELKAVCTAHQETAEAAAKAFGAELAFHDYNQMFAHPDVDVVAVCVRVPYHYEITMAALKAGKGVFCEWPLGANTAEAQEMAALAKAQGVSNVVGLQGRADATVNYIHDLVADGYVGDVLACKMTLISPGVLERVADRAWMGDPDKGGNTLTIAAGHSIDALNLCVGEFAEVSARLSTQVKEWKLTDTGGTAETRSPDNILISGQLESGAVASVHVANVAYGGSGWQFEIYGRGGALFASGSQSPQLGDSRLMGQQGNAAPAELPVPDRYVLVPEGTPKGAPFNVAQTYARLADDRRSGAGAAPDFDLAVRRHRMIDAFWQSSNEGRAVKLR